MSVRKKLPPLASLTVFEAASRLSSFTKAADELGITQAAVSHQIHQMERDFGFPLFARLHRRVVLTEKGKVLSAAATEAFGLLTTAVNDITKEAFRDELVISATVAFSYFWLMPRIFEFSRDHPEIEVRIVTQDSIPNVISAELDAVIRFGNGMWSNGRAERLFGDEIFPVCSPDYAKASGPIDCPVDLLSHSLISYDTADPMWTGWDEWLPACSVVVPKKTLGLRCSFYTEAIYAALNGQGIVLGWRHLVQDLLNQNRLVRVTNASIDAAGAYYVVSPTKRQPKPAARLFLDWITSSSLACPMDAAGSPAVQTIQTSQS
ncbi:LysR substrate-binding domain-containing protein [Mesorhizobium sp. VK22B]|uniref:LysR substrate-binding domain-containing protein n=1 Tax=Mesorhizobium captivum TaxID=3072319 RepID=A0ABU4ZE83_9HYPH|nr:LysR substrate-binding domain-containing protein [Mesorhizobium sp. VK22B]MDX8496267.1 LysR substrate-binding domain-containing protein [Mesorhizobium sp. VK22B]